MEVSSQILCFLQCILFAASSPIIRQTDLQQTDQGLYNKQFFEGDIYTRHQKGFNLKNVGAVPWPNGVVIYRLDEKIGCPDSQQCQILMKSFHHYHTHSCIRFQEWTGEADFVYIFFNSDRGACWSAIGKTGGPQLLSLGRHCWYQGIVVHELGHTIGFPHEMNRADRDDYIQIVWANILDDFHAAFEKHADKPDDDFDLKSIMMYDEFAFSKSPKLQTIQVKDNTVIGPIWKKPGLSKTDMDRIEKLYQCDKSRQLQGLPYDVSCTFGQHTCGFKSAGKNPWKWNQVNATDGYVYTVGSEDNANDSTSYFVSVNFFGKDEPQKTGMGCVRFWYMMRGNEGVYLKLRQSFLSQPTQLAYVPEDTFDLWESENVTDTWVSQQVSLYVTRPFKLIFEASPGATNTGLITLDDFELTFSSC